MSIEIFFNTAIERYKMLLRRREGVSILTEDPILGEFRFCNVFREDDRVTTWLRENVREKLGDNHLQQFRAAVVFRWFNNIETGRTLLPFLLGETNSLSWACSAVKKMAANGERILNPAYMIKSPPGMDKATGLFQCIEKVFDDQEMIVSEILEAQKLKRAHELLCRYPYLGPFMSYQMVCDLRYTPLLKNVRDEYLWTAPGPGSARGCGRMGDNDPGLYNYNSKAHQEQLVAYMRYLLIMARDVHWPKEWPKWELSTVQHWCCEYDKYMRVKLGEGTPKQRYRPAS